MDTNQGEIIFHYYITRHKKGGHDLWLWCWI